MFCSQYGSSKVCKTIWFNLKFRTNKRKKLNKLYTGSHRSPFFYKRPTVFINSWYPSLCLPEPWFLLYVLKSITPPENFRKLVYFLSCPIFKPIPPNHTNLQLISFFPLRKTKKWQYKKPILWLWYILETRSKVSKHPEVDPCQIKDIQTNKQNNCAILYYTTTTSHICFLSILLLK